jgi:signal transduction histidine kinase
MAGNKKIKTLFRVKKLRTIFIIYWILLAYIIAALIWWFIALYQQNETISQFKKNPNDISSKNYDTSKIEEDRQRRIHQYVGEGVTFLLFIIGGAVFIFRIVQRQFRQSQQQQNFMMAVAHELKTPIAVTKLNLETIQKHKLNEEQQSRLLINTLQEANRLNDLCNNMLVASQIEGGGYNMINEQIELSQLLRECVNDFAIRFPKKQITANIAEDIIVNGDYLLLQLAINNLIDNAIKYADSKTPVNVNLLRSDDLIQITISDEGKGIADEDKAKIFDKFYRVGNRHTKEAKGTGLGLYLTKKIIEQHKGSIIVTDNKPQGSNFVIEFVTDK